MVGWMLFLFEAAHLHITRKRPDYIQYLTEVVCALNVQLRAQHMQCLPYHYVRGAAVNLGETLI